MTHSFRAEFGFPAIMSVSLLNADSIAHVLIRRFTLPRSRNQVKRVQQRKYAGSDFFGLFRVGLTYWENVRSFRWVGRFVNWRRRRFRRSTQSNAPMLNVGDQHTYPMLA